MHASLEEGWMHTHTPASWQREGIASRTPPSSGTTRLPAAQLQGKLWVKLVSVVGNPCHGYPVMGTP